MPTIKLSRNEPLPDEAEISAALLDRLEAVVAAHPRLSLSEALTLAIEQFVTVAEHLKSRST